MPKTPDRTPPHSDRWLSIYAAAYGLFLGLTLLKFGNPIILDHLVVPPATLDEYLHQSWPVAWGYFFLIIVAAAALPFLQMPRTQRHWLVWLPAVWLGWQFVSATGTVDRLLTETTLRHFGACVVCFYLGFLVVGRSPDLRWFWIVLVAALILVFASGFSQRYGGIEQVRRYLEEHQKTGWHDVPREELMELLKTGMVIQNSTNGLEINPDLLKKLANARVYGTLVYPNALAGVILLLLPVTLASLWQATRRVRHIPRGVLFGLIAYAGLSCLYWSGSKAGWLIALAMGLVMLRRLSLPKTLQWALVAVVLVCGVGAFWLKFSTYFKKGAPSVGARFDYWRVAGQTLLDKPVLGSGPGTFYTVYHGMKRPESEMARLAHNDYLEQGSDSGLIGMLSYAGFIFGSLILLYRNSHSDRDLKWGFLWVGLAGWALQGFVEFGLYIPALAWISFSLFGLLWARSEQPKPGSSEV